MPVLHGKGKHRAETRCRAWHVPRARKRDDTNKLILKMKNLKLRGVHLLTEVTL